MLYVWYQSNTPSQSPDRNPVEHFWNLTERKIRKHVKMRKEIFQTAPKYPENWYHQCQNALMKFWFIAAVWFLITVYNLQRIYFLLFWVVCVHRPCLFMKLRFFVNWIPITYIHIRNWWLQPFSQDYWPNFSHRLCCVC